MNQNLTFALILGTLLAIACGVPSCDAQGQSDATQQDRQPKAADILSLDGELSGPPAERPEGQESVPEMQDNGSDTQGDTSVVQVIVLSASWCAPCQQVKRSLSHLKSLQPSWRIGPQENAHFRTLDIEREGRSIHQRFGSPNIPAFIVRKKDGSEELRVGWNGGAPTSVTAIDTLAGMFDIQPEAYRGVGNRRERKERREIGDALRDHLQGRTVEGFYDSTFDVQTVIEKLTGGMKTVKVSDTVYLSVPQSPRVELSGRDGVTRVSFASGAPSISYQNRFLSASVSIPYVEFNSDASKMTVGLKGLPDFPIYLEW